MSARNAEKCVTFISKQMPIRFLPRQAQDRDPKLEDFLGTLCVCSEVFKADAARTWLKLTEFGCSEGQLEAEVTDLGEDEYILL